MRNRVKGTREIEIYRVNRVIRVEMRKPIEETAKQLRFYRFLLDEAELEL